MRENIEELMSENITEDDYELYDEEPFEWYELADFGEFQDFDAEYSEETAWESIADED